MDEPNPRHQGKDFQKGFLTTVLFGVASLFLSNSRNGVAVLYLAAFMVLFATIIAFARGRRHVAYGILTAAIAVPLLLIGACFTLVAINFG